MTHAARFLWQLPTSTRRTRGGVEMPKKDEGGRQVSDDVPAPGPEAANAMGVAWFVITPPHPEALRSETARHSGVRKETWRTKWKKKL